MSCLCCLTDSYCRNSSISATVDGHVEAQIFLFVWVLFKYFFLYFVLLFNTFFCILLHLVATYKKNPLGLFPSFGYATLLCIFLWLFLQRTCWVTRQAHVTARHRQAVFQGFSQVMIPPAVCELPTAAASSSTLGVVILKNFSLSVGRVMISLCSSNLFFSHN